MRIAYCKLIWTRLTQESRPCRGVAPVGLKLFWKCQSCCQLQMYWFRDGAKRVNGYPHKEYTKLLSKTEGISTATRVTQSAVPLPLVWVSFQSSYSYDSRDQNNQQHLGETNSYQSTPIKGLVSRRITSSNQTSSKYLISICNTTSLEWVQLLRVAYSSINEEGLHNKSRTTQLHPFWKH